MPSFERLQGARRQSGPPSFPRYVGRVGVPADSYARVLAFAVSQPEDMDVNEIIFRPTAQEL